MQLSTRNQLRGKIWDLKKGPVTTEVIIEVKDPATIVATITTGSAESMELKAGDDVVALIKASSVIIGK
jgi:molybdopterin-binding protein